jgi:hypothetical protein
MSRKVAKPARVGMAGERIAWISWSHRRIRVQGVLSQWTEPPAPWEGTAERRYARLLLETGAVLDAYSEDGRWNVCGVED